jgi:hypothetical protein
MWVRQGRTDAWIAHKLDVSVDELARFKRDHDLEADGDGGRARPADPLSVPAPEPMAEEPEELDEPEEPEEDELEREPRRRGRGRRRGGRRGGRPVADEEAEEVEDEEELVPAAGLRDGNEDDSEEGAPRKRRRRGRRGGRRHRGRRNAFEATFDHGEEGYGLWLDPSVAENPVYSEHWAGHRAVTVTVEAEAITIRRADAARSEPAGDEAADEAAED